MSSLKGLLFGQYANEGLNLLVEEMQKKYKPKKGRRFNHNNITYEISRPGIMENMIEFEISSKIPQDELSNNKDMKTYFSEIKKIISKGKIKPVSIEMENIVWDSRKDKEKERDYVKLLYQYPLDNLFDDKEVPARLEKTPKDSLPNIPSALTPQGKIILAMVRENMQGLARDNIEHLVEANQKVRTAISA